MPLFLTLLSMALALVLLIFNWKVNPNALFLSLLIILIASLQTRQYLGIYAPNPFWLAIVINNPAPLWSMIGPCLFFYVRNVLTDRMSFRRSDLLHTLPFWITLAGTLPYLLTPFSYKLEVASLDIKNLNAAYYIRYNWMMSNQWNLFSRSLVQVGYAVVCLWMLARFQRRRKHDALRSLPQSGLIQKWLVAVSLFVLLTGIYYFTGASLFFRNPTMARNIVTHYSWIYAFGLILTCLPSLVLIFPEILYGIPRLENPRAADTLPVDVEVPMPSGFSIDPSAPPAVEAAPEAPDKTEVAKAESLQELGQWVLDFMEREKPYLSRDFSIEDLADMLGVPRHHMYYCFKNVLKKKFVTLRTEFRVLEAQRQILVADLENTTLYTIGLSCGFTSHSAFYRAFREVAGCSPGEYLERHGPKGEDGA
jgi:AraC-like DNA-binding protein